MQLSGRPQGSRAPTAIELLRAADGGDARDMQARPRGGRANGAIELLRAADGGDVAAGSARQLGAEPHPRGTAQVDMDTGSDAAVHGVALADMEDLGARAAAVRGAARADWTGVPTVVLDVHATADSATGCPYSLGRSPTRTAALAAYDELLSIIIFVALVAGLSPGSPPSSTTAALDPGGTVRATVVPRLAARHGAQIDPAVAAIYSFAAVWRWLCDAAELASRRRLVLRGGCRDELGGARGTCVARLSGDLRCHAESLAGAIYWLRERRPSLLSTGLVLHAGDWRISDICRRWPAEIARELASFTWPIDSEHELARLIEARHASPAALIGCEFTAAVREEYHRQRGRVALSVDSRPSLVPGPHAILDVRLVVHAKRWDDAIFFVPCTHQVLSDTRALDAKALDGRTFWGILLFIYCWCVIANRVAMEQPDTIIPSFYISPTQRLRPCEVGDADSKPINLYTRGRAPVVITHPGAQGTQSGHGHLRDFPDADARDRWRSSWARFPHLAAACVQACVCDEGAEAAAQPVFAAERERFAAAWFDRGLPVPYDYDTPDGQPAAAADRAPRPREERDPRRRCALTE